MPGKYPNMSPYNAYAKYNKAHYSSADFKEMYRKLDHGYERLRILAGAKEKIPKKRPQKFRKPHLAKF